MKKFKTTFVGLEIDQSCFTKQDSTNCTQGNKHARKVQTKRFLIFAHTKLCAHKSIKTLVLSGTQMLFKVASWFFCLKQIIFSTNQRVKFSITS